jgi:cyclic pyranopterin phosphate synthase
MISITDKVNTLRIAMATSTIRASAAAIECLKTNNVPKKDILIVARVAGVAAAKKTGDIIPYCHPLTLDSVAIDFNVLEDHIIVTATVQTIWRTGVEMEALCAASVAALTIYDMLKPIDKDMEITSTKLAFKKGGKSSFKEWTPEGFSAAVIVTSDGTSQGLREDKSGKIIEERLKDHGIIPSYVVLPDDYDQIVAKLKELCAEGVQLIITTGGTGLGPRDTTVEATLAVMDREVPGIMEAARSYGQSRTPYAMLSRGLAAQKGQTLIINLPGSSKGVSESLNAIFPSLLHAYSMMQGGGH